MRVRPFGAAAMCAAGFTAGASAQAQRPPTAPTAPTAPPAPPRRPTAEEFDRDGGPRGLGERVGLLITATSFGFRLGSTFNLATGITPETHPTSWWIAPTAISLVLPTLTYFIEGRHPLRRGRVFATIAGGALGYVTSLSLASWYYGLGYPRGDVLTGWVTFGGTVGGFAAGYLLGALTDSRAATGLYASTFVIAGALQGVFACGLVRCAGNLGGFAAAGAVLGLGSAWVLHGVLRPTLREMRYVALGGLLGALPMIGVGAAYLARDGSLGAAEYQRLSVFGAAGTILGGLTFWMMAHRTNPVLPRALRNTRAQLVPQFDPATRMVGLSLSLQ